MASKGGILDSSPIAPLRRSPRKATAAATAKSTAIPPRPLKRSASAASLPTPPRTRHKSHARSKVSVESDSDSHSDAESSDDGGRLLVNRKKLRTEEKLPGHDEALDSEDEFWLGTKAKKESKEPKAAADKTTVASTPVQLPVSPPPSRRQTRSTTKVVVAEPVTPPRRITTRRTVVTVKKGPIRDSPNNPFLMGSPSSPSPPKTPRRREEKPTVTYVFRGMKAEFPNPFYNPPPGARARSLLPLDDPEYEVDDTCPPRLLFTRAAKTPPPVKRRVPRAVESEEEEEEEEEEKEEARPKSKQTARQKLTFAEELERAEAKPEVKKVQKAQKEVKTPSKKAQASSSRC